ncbi:DNA repair protein rad50, partial [Tulasnella sp. 408]
EDSYWPLAEASVLKKKFDDIFEATKYTKALDNIKGIRKERVADLKAEKERLAGLSVERKHADKLTDKISELTSSAEDKEERISVLQEEAERISAENLQFYEQAMKFKEHYLKAEELEKRKLTDKEDARALENSLGKEKAGPDVTDNWLQEQVNTFQSSARDKEKQVDEIRKQIDEDKENESALRRKLRSVESQKGHEEDVAARQSMIERLGELHGLGTHSQMSLDEDAVHEFVYKLKSLQRKNASEKEQAQASSAINAKNREYTDKIANLRSQIETLKRERESTQSSMNQLQTSIAHAESAIDKNKSLESEIKFNNDDLADKRARLDKMTAEFAAAKFDDQIAAKTKLMQTVEIEREALYSEQTRSATQADERAKLDLKRSDLKKKQAMIERILETQASRFRTFFEVDAQADTMESDIDHLTSTKTRELTRLENEYNKANRESAEAHSTHERLKKELAEKQKEVDDLAKKIHKAANAQSEVGVEVTLEQALEDAATELKFCQEDVENEIHAMEIKAGQLDAKLQEGRATETKMESDKRELSALRSRMPSLDTQESSIRAKIEELRSSQRDEERRLSEKLSAVEEQFGVLNASVLELDNIQSRIEKFTSENRAQRLQNCIQQAADLETQINGVIAELEAKREKMAAAQTEIDQGGARLSNLRDNLRLRRLRNRIEETETELAALPMEEAANSKRTFDIKWGAMKKRESDIKEKGEVSTMQAQIDGHNKDLASDFKNIKKRYMDQLIKVKMSDMANNDLEKYAKALDSAIMKYHTLKMEEVNDIMRHLWNKTYQGTDIDGIMIRSEGDGGGTRKSYNYRVVMMKDQVEMDMRGRCSAGQKMLASIIIRLALSDSFAQDCGILALDEPTNALDVENIEALAASLVEIINERKRAANFQLIIITHDENFLRKLGENGVIQDY